MRHPSAITGSLTYIVNGGYDCKLRQEGDSEFEILELTLDQEAL